MKNTDGIEAKGYLTEHQDVSSFVTKDELAEVRADATNSDNLITSSENGLYISGTADYGTY